MAFKISRKGRATAKKFTAALARAFRELPIDSEPSVRFQATRTRPPKPDQTR